MKVKARVKATGEIVEVVRLDECMRGIVIYKTTEGDIYPKDCLEFDYYNNPDYWTRLEHQAAIAAMQGQMAEGLCSNTSYMSYGNIVEIATSIAHALVEKLKNTNE